MAQVTRQHSDAQQKTHQTKPAKPVVEPAPALAPEPPVQARIDPRAMTPRNLVALQRTVGNRQVSRMVARTTATRTAQRSGDEVAAAEPFASAELEAVGAGNGLSFAGSAASPNDGTGLNSAKRMGDGLIQAKLTVNAPGDQYEQEADAVAAQVMTMRAPAPVQRADEDELQEKPLAERVQRAEEDELQTRRLTSATAMPLVQREPQGIRDVEGARQTLQNPTWDPNALVDVGGKKEKGGWVDATSARDTSEAQTNIGSSDKPNWVDKRMVAGTNLDPNQANQKLQSGQLSHDELNEITPEQVAQVNPLGDAPRNILKHALHESWHHAKESLLADGANKAARQMLMAKLWEFRQWHHDMILKRTQADSEIGKEGLTEWKAAGSTTLTSDIDVNLKGNKTEKAVGVFNRLFKADGWSKEAGVVYDVNVYAVDFMHKDTFMGLAEEGGKIESHKFQDGPQPTRVSAKEGKRTGSAGGGVGTSNSMLEERMLKADADLQRVWSLVKMRLYMTGTQWQEYLRDAEVSPDTQAAVDLRYNAYMNDLKTKMLDGEHIIQQADDMKHTGFAVIEALAKEKAGPTGDPEEVKMAASNRLYEAKLLEMAEMRNKVQTQIKLREEWLKAGKGDDAEMLDAAIDGNLAILRDLISECAMLSNEAYVTDGAVNHAVVGLQSKIGIAQTKSESMDAFNENVADSLKEIARHSGTLGEAAYKAGKYLWRMADAAKNLGSKDEDIQNLYVAGYKLANEIKGGSKSQVELEQDAANALKSILPEEATASPEALMAFVRRLGARVAKAHAAEVANKGQERAQPVQATKPI
jgi:hypothetical protein